MSHASIRARQPTSARAVVRLTSEARESVIMHTPNSVPSRMQSRTMSR